MVSPNNHRFGVTDMARIETQTRPLYQFDELSDDAKERARNWFRTGMDFEPDFIIEDAARIAAILGIEFDTREVRLMNGSTRKTPRVWFSGFSSQGDGASFEGSYTYAKGSQRTIRDYAPTDTELHAIADALAAAQRPCFYRLCATSITSSLYPHSGTMSVDAEYCDDSYRPVPESAVNAITDTLRRFADWIYNTLEREYDWMISDESLDENIRCNEYEFIESGDIA